MRLYGELLMTRMLHDARDTFPPSGRKARRKSLCYASRRPQRAPR